MKEMNLKNGEILMEVDKEIEKLSLLQSELTAMINLGADIDLLKKQRDKINYQSNKVSKLIESLSKKEKQ